MVTTESPSDLPTGGLCLVFSLGLCLSLNLQCLDSSSSGCLICAQNKKPGKRWAGVGQIIDYLTTDTSQVYVESHVLSVMIDPYSKTLQHLTLQ